MRISKYLLPVTLAFIAYCSTFTIAKSVIQVKSSTLDFKRKLIDESHRHLREDVAKDDVEKEYVEKDDVVPREEDEKGRVTKGKDEERRGGGYGGGGNDDVAGANPLYAPPVTKFYPSYFEDKEKLERWFKKRKHIQNAIELLNKLANETSLTEKQKSDIATLVKKLQAQQRSMQSLDQVK